MPQTKEQIYEEALEAILFQLKGIYEDELMAAEGNIRRIACNALGKDEADYVTESGECDPSLT